MEGWISVHRQIQGHWLSENKPYNYLAAWVDLLLLANHKENKFPFGGEVLTVKRGQFITSEHKLMRRWGWSKSKVRRFLVLLENDSMIVKKTDQKRTTISICKYDTYQNPETNVGPIADHQRTDSGPSADPNNNDNKENNDNNKSEGPVVDDIERMFLMWFNCRPTLGDRALLENLIKQYDFKSVKEAFGTARARLGDKINLKYVEGILKNNRIRNDEPVRKYAAAE